MAADFTGNPGTDDTTVPETVEDKTVGGDATDLFTPGSSPDPPKTKGQLWPR